MGRFFLKTIWIATVLSHLYFFFVFFRLYIFFVTMVSQPAQALFFTYTFFSLIYFFYNHDLRASSSAPPLLLGPNLFFDNRGVQASVDTPWLISEPIYYYFLFFFLIRFFVHFYFYLFFGLDDFYNFIICAIIMIILVIIFL